ncbi:hypothetical protein Acid345_0044 [Candidatus Koribacter versatilis Ellin345]|uniref:SnoaL-like domain-containing protein n=1 Tax=Koribacter versatilis (strain Ellin345) TaxID=204669 RepID=Q1IVQ1_KORVE|nr:nuclear transport factor 2 family protein [Candidatus Koribacter versatilis]ABF39049.1 hypothetical protein Acid345_0044 [Candidatus Koribacter versatilis Ellin345]
MKSIRVAVCLAVIFLIFAASGRAQSAPDKAYLQKIWDGWQTLNADNQTQYYAQGPHQFFDIAPVKYNNWDEYKKTVGEDLAQYSKATFKINDDAQIHKAGDIYWGSCTIDSDMLRKDGKSEKNTFRWTFIFQKQNGKWLIVHEHVSMAMPS